MKLLVTCDQVFDVLTRGPFPSGSADDDNVQRHLDACHECRQLAEALRPAVALLHEALPAREAAELPSYGPPDADAGLCERADGALAARIRRMMDQIEIQPRRLAAQERWLYAVRLVAASVLLAALGTLIAGIFQPGEGTRQMHVARGPAVMSGFHEPSAEGLLRLTSLSLPAGCLPGAPATSSTVDSSAGQNDSRPLTVASGHVCCTRCHAAGKEGAVLTQRSVAALQQSCTACHAARG